MDSINTVAAQHEGAAGRRRLISVAIYTILLAGLATAWLRFGDLILAAAAQAQPHAPDLSVLARQPPVIQAHVLAALGAVVVGAGLMSWRKGRTAHRLGGWIWVVLMAVTAGTSFFIVGLNGDRWSFIHLLSGWTAVILPLAVIAARRHRVMQHRGMMMGMFYGGLLIAGALNFIPGRTLWNVFF